AVEETRDIVPRRKRDRARIRLERLHEDAAWRVAPATPGELGQQLKGALLRAEVRQTETGIGVDDRGERDAGEVMSLGHHLGADEHHSVGVGEAGQRRCKRTWP